MTTAQTTCSASAPTDFALGAEVRIRKTRETGHITGQQCACGHAFHEITTDTGGVRYPLADKDLEAIDP